MAANEKKNGSWASMELSDEDLAQVSGGLNTGSIGFIGQKQEKPQYRCGRGHTCTLEQAVANQMKCPSCQGTLRPASFLDCTEGRKA